jgi:hypothetical protein
VSETSAETIADFGPWNPGIGSDLPARLLPLSTIFLPDNVFTSVTEACELRELTGLELEQLVVFRPQRLVVHELLIRITGDISVPDGNKVEDLGINFRRITHTILTRHLQPHMREIVRTYETVRRDIVKLVVAEVATAFDKPSPNVASPVTQYAGFTRWLRSLRRPRNAAVAVARDEDDWAREERVLREWGVKSQSADDPMQKATYRALLRIASAVRGRHGHLWGNPAVFAPLVTGLACNEYGAELIGQQIEPLIREAAQAEGYGWLPAQQEPVVMNTKGASASGKSTMRPLQKKLAGEIGVNWSDFALVSPDIWRKYLLDYGSLGDDFKYAGTLTGKELAIIDQKLDRYMAQKAERGGMSHLLIDRFRFDSFAADSEEAGSNLLTRFGHHVYMFFMITPPHVTVERSWKRGHDVGRFKAVDDLLAHNVEAYTGMPELFFTWALRTNKRVHYEFLDNTESGGLPRTVAFGWNGEMNVLDVKSMLDIDRYRKIDIHARRPEEVYADAHAMAAENNTEFLRQCARLLPAVNFADRDTGIVYARIEGGKLAWIGGVALDKALADSQTRAGLAAIAPAISSALDRARIDQNEAPRVLQATQFRTLGRWGERRVGLAQAVFPDEVR